MRKLITFLGALGLSAAAGTTLVACGIADTIRYDIHDFVEEFDLGGFEFVPEENEILSRAKEKNEELNLDEVVVSYINIDDNWATISARPGSRFYLPGEFDVFYTVETKTLQDIVRDKNIGVFPMTPTLGQVMDRVEEKYTNLELSEVSITEFNRNNRTLILSVNRGSTVYPDDIRASVELTYTRDLRMIDEFIPDGEINDRFADLMELTGEEFNTALANANERYEQIQGIAGWNEYFAITVTTRSPLESIEEFTRRISVAFENLTNSFGEQRVEGFSKDYFTVLSLRIKNYTIDDREELSDLFNQLNQNNGLHYMPLDPDLRTWFNNLLGYAANKNAAFVA